jgi:hypothetical protein
MPTKTKPKADETYIALYSFAGNDLSVPQGMRLRGDHEIVQKNADKFAPADTPDDELHRLRQALNAPPPPPEPIGRVKLRVLNGQGSRGVRSALDGGGVQTVLQGDRTYSSGETLIAEGKDAQHLLDTGMVEVVKKLRPRKEQPQVEKPAPTGLTIGGGA